MTGVEAETVEGTNGFGGLKKVLMEVNADFFFSFFLAAKFSSHFLEFLWKSRLTSPPVPTGMSNSQMGHLSLLVELNFFFFGGFSVILRAVETRK
jgi:hypothetical protein